MYLMRKKADKNDHQWSEVPQSAKNKFISYWIYIFNCRLKWWVDICWLAKYEERVLTHKLYYLNINMYVEMRQMFA